MPKLKTHKGAAARFRVTGSGKLVRMKRMRSHNKLKKPKRVRREFAKKLEVNSADVNRIKKLIPYATR